MAPKKAGAAAAPAKQPPSPFEVHVSNATNATKQLKKLTKGGPAKIETNMEALVPLVNHALPRRDYTCPQDREVRKAAVTALGKLPAEALATQVGTLIGKLADPEDAVRTAAVLALSKATTIEGSHGSAVAAHFEHHQQGVREAALQVWAKVDALALSEVATSAVRPLVTHPMGEVRATALHALCQLTPTSLAAHADAAVAALEDEEGDVRQAAKRAIDMIDPDVLAPFADAVMERLHAQGKDSSTIAAAEHTLACTRPLLTKFATELPAAVMAKAAGARPGGAQAEAAAAEE